MKLKLIPIALASLVLSMSSCDKKLDLTPEFFFDQNNLSSLNDIETILGGSYAKLRAINYYNSAGNGSAAFSTLPDMMSDNLQETGESLANFFTLVEWEVTSDESNVEAAWSDAYAAIVQANFVINNVDRFAATDPKKANRLKGQALALRAFVHFDILRYWGEDFVRTSTKLGIPYKENVDQYTLPPRLTVQASLDKIYGDLNQALTLLADVDVAVNTAANKSRIDLTAARALQSRINLYTQQYAAAEATASQIIAGFAAPALADSAAYRNIWIDQGAYDQIWNVQFDPGQGSPSGNVYFASGNRNSFRPDPLLRAQFGTNDIRTNTFFGRVALRGTPREVVVKHRGRTPLTDGTVNWKVFRVTEQYLIRAEARARTGNEAGALADLNLIRAARIRNYVPGTETGQALLDAIALERRKELFCEGHRFFDAKRTDRVMTRANGSELLPASRSWVWPIPFAELNVNPMQQSPGY